MNKPVDPPCRLYLITPPALSDITSFGGDLNRALDAGDVGAVQIRLKDINADAIQRAAEVIVPICQSHDVAVLMNDSAQLALDTGCDGVHVGEDDDSLESARNLLGRDAVIGVSCYNSLDRAMSASDGKNGAGADYVAFGAMYMTMTKIPKVTCPIDVIESWTTATTVPSVAIGGITPDNAPPIIEAGADFIAVIASVWSHPDGPAAGVAAFEDVLKRYR